MNELHILIFTSTCLLTRHRQHHIQLSQLLTHAVGLPISEALAADPPQPQGVVTFIFVTFKSGITLYTSFRKEMEMSVVRHFLEKWVSASGGNGVPMAYKCLLCKREALSPHV